jgi:hypothetical protein
MGIARDDCCRVAGRGRGEHDIVIGIGEDHRANGGRLGPGKR